MIVVDPRRTESAEWGDLWLGHRRRQRHRALQHDRARDHRQRPAAPHVHRARDHRVRGVQGFGDGVDARARRGRDGVPAEIIQEVAHAYAKADRAVICWTLGITEHHNAVDNVLALINLSLLTGHVGVYGSGVNPLRGQNNVQGGGDMGAIPNKLPGFQDIETDAAARERFERAWGVPIIAEVRMAPHPDVPRDGARRAARALRDRREPRQLRGRQATHATPLLENLDCLIVQDIFMTQDGGARRRGVPGVRRVGGGRGHRDEQRAAGPAGAQGPGSARRCARTTSGSSCSWRSGSASTGARSRAHDAWEELRTLSPMHAGMSYERLEELGGIQWPCPGRGPSRHAVPPRPPVGVRRPRGSRAPRRRSAW